MTDETFDRNSWERRWAQALRESPEKLVSRLPNAHLLAEVGDLRPGLALDAGCGHGSEAIWLATSGWRVTAGRLLRPRSTTADRLPTLSARTLPSASSGWRATS